MGRERPAAAVGRKMEKVVPTPSVETKVMNPRWAFTIERAVERPSPLPRPTPFVVKNGSKIWPFRMSGMPQPVSETSIRTKSPGTASGCGRGRRGRHVAVEAVIASLPPDGHGVRAFTERLRSTWWSWVGSPEIAGRPGATSISIRIDFGKVLSRKVRISAKSRRGDREALALHAAGEEEDLADELGAAAGARRDDLEELGPSPCRHLVLQELPGHHDRGEDVVQVVRDPPGEGPDALEPLVLEPPGLEELALGDVGDEPLEVPRPAVGPGDRPGPAPGPTSPRPCGCGSGR
jgi:hypothetical protein